MVSNHIVSDHLAFVDLSLSRIRTFLNNIGNPQDKIKNIIHIAGTNGKGSTCAFLRSILEGHNYSVNVFTSPHLVSYNERFRLSGKLITDEYLEQIKTNLEKIEGFKELTIFELTMIIGFVAFAEKKADFNIIEVGLGGRLDASNVIKNPLLSIITTIDIDHINFLGTTLDKIAYEKAGIIKKNSTIITDYQQKEVIKVIKKQSLKMNAKLIAGDIDYKIDFPLERNQDKDEKEINLEKNKYPILKYNNKELILDKLSLQGNHQYYNASLAIIACINILKDNFNYIELSSMLSNAEWKGRLQSVNNLYGVNFKNTDVYLDGAHNVSGVRVLCNFIETKYNNDRYKIHIFIGMLVKKDLDGVLENLSILNNNFDIYIYPMDIENHESYSAKEIFLCSNNHNLKFVIYKDLSEELNKIEKSTDKNVIIICGSLYMLGKILEDNSNL